ncbi:hypothetical protein G7Z17_g9615 [Cylindrodendrum hubeiense]|uniref:non-specific serine/threonine protein kinase n=1 Tax=Cylindrodendrum hubeiense TaxID=595255 RepID=A0A9P5H4N7_9HYPO|nr:hypothetical protein G7Z17_g9615 [Cylindrodendrum hubeiense]
MAQQSPRHSDLVRDSQLTTRFLPGGATQHAIYSTPVQSGRRRRIRVEETWRREKELGNGTFGRVWLEGCVAGPATGKLRAVKEIDKNSAVSFIDYSRELEAVAKFSHEKYVHCFVECYGWYESEHMVFIAMEYLQHGDLQKYLNRPFPEAQVKDIAAQLVEGLGYMHDNGFTHRDLKPANILVCQPDPDWWVKIADFGITKRAEQENTVLRTMIGTEGYLAPEVIGFIVSQSSTSSDSFYTSAVDVWALGELLFRMVSKRSAFLTRQDLFGYVVRGQAFPVSELTAVGASQDCCEFVAKSMMADPGHRLTAREASAHPWVQSLLEEPVVSSETPQEFNWPDSSSSVTGPVTPFEDTAQWSTAMFTTAEQTAYHSLSNTSNAREPSLTVNPAQFPNQKLQPPEDNIMMPGPNAPPSRPTHHAVVGDLISDIQTMNITNEIATPNPPPKDPSPHTITDDPIDLIPRRSVVEPATQSPDQTATNLETNNPFRKARKNGKRSNLELRQNDLGGESATADDIEVSIALMRKVQFMEREIAAMGKSTDKISQAQQQELISQSDAILAEVHRQIRVWDSHMSEGGIPETMEGLAEIERIGTGMDEILKSMGEITTQWRINRSA